MDQHSAVVNGQVEVQRLCQIFHSGAHKNAKDLPGSDSFMVTSIDDTYNKPGTQQALDQMKWRNF